MNNIDNEVFVIKRKLFPMEAMKREKITVESYVHR